MNKILHIILKLFAIVVVIFTASVLSAQSPGFFLDSWEERVAKVPVSEPGTKPTSDPTVTVTVDVTDTLNKVPGWIFGNNAVTWDNGLRSNPTAMADLNNLSPNVLRWPGGNLSNEYFWNVSYGDRPTDIPSDISPWYGMNTQSWQMSVDEYYDLLEKSNSEGLICVNYSYARYGTGPNPAATAAHMAAEWVRYDKGRTKFWEIGNENFGDWEAGYQIDISQNHDGQPEYISGQLYGQHCKVFLDSMHAAAAETGADIMIGINVYDAETSYNQIMTNWNEQVMPEVGDLVDFLAVHSYFTPYNENSSVSTILNSHHVPQDIMTVLENDMADAGKTMLPVAMTEWNIFAVGSQQAVSYINGMLAALTLGEFVKNNYGMSNRWDLVNGWDGGNDMGMFSVGGEPGVDSYNPRAVFFYMYYWQKYFGDRMVNASVSGNSDVVAWASTFSSGETGTVIINKSAVDQVVKIDFEGLQPGNLYYTMTLTGGTDNPPFSRKVFLNGIGTDEAGGGPDNYASIKAFEYDTTGGIKIDLPALGVVYMMTESAAAHFLSAVVEEDPGMITAKFSDSIVLPASPAGLELSANGDAATITDIEVNPENNREIFIYLNEELKYGDHILLSYSGTDIVTSRGKPIAPFTVKTVTNLLPKPPDTLQITVRTSEGSIPVESCSVLFNLQIKYTDENGQVSFEAPDGNYSIFLSKQGLNTLIHEIDLNDNANVELYMDSTYMYQVHFLVTDSHTDKKLPGVNIEVDINNLVTDSAGEATAVLTNFSDKYLVRLSKDYYYRDSASISVHADTTIEWHLVPSHASIGFRITDGDQPLNGVLVQLDNESKYTSGEGTCTFEHVGISNPKTYSIEKEYYFTVDGVLNIVSDSIFEFQMQKSMADITLQIESPTGSPIYNAYAWMGQDTSWFDQNGEALFTNYAINQQHTFTIRSDNYPDYSENFILLHDTTIHVMLISANSVRKENNLKIWPNPATGYVMIDPGNTPVKVLELIDNTGKTIIIHENDLSLQTIKLELPAKSGLYFLRIISNEGSMIYKLMVE